MKISWLLLLLPAIIHGFHFKEYDASYNITEQIIEENIETTAEFLTTIEEEQSSTELKIKDIIQNVLKDVLGNEKLGINDNIEKLMVSEEENEEKEMEENGNKIGDIDDQYNITQEDEEENDHDKNDKKDDGEVNNDDTKDEIDEDKEDEFIEDEDKKDEKEEGDDDNKDKKDLNCSLDGDIYQLKLFWEKGMEWQDSRKEKAWCAQCDDDCDSGEPVRIRECDEDKKDQLWIFYNCTVRPVINSDVCFTASSSKDFEGKIELEECTDEKSKKQKFRMYDNDNASKKFQFKLLEPGNEKICLSQEHHPRDKEKLQFFSCKKAEKNNKSIKDDTSHWVVGAFDGHRRAF